MFECAAAFLAVWNVCDEFWEVNAALSSNDTVVCFLVSS